MTILYAPAGAMAVLFLLAGPVRGMGPSRVEGAAKGSPWRRVTYAVCADVPPPLRELARVMGAETALDRLGEISWHEVWEGRGEGWAVTSTLAGATSPAYGVRPMRGEVREVRREPPPPSGLLAQWSESLDLRGGERSVEVDLFADRAVVRGQSSPLEGRYQGLLALLREIAAKPGRLPDPPAFLLGGRAYEVVRVEAGPEEEIPVKGAGVRTRRVGIALLDRQAGKVVRGPDDFAIWSGSEGAWKGEIVRFRLLVAPLVTLVASAETLEGPGLP